MRSSRMGRLAQAGASKPAPTQANVAKSGITPRAAAGPKPAVLPTPKPAAQPTPKPATAKTPTPTQQTDAKESIDRSAVLDSIIEDEVNSILQEYDGDAPAESTPAKAESTTSGQKKPSRGPGRPRKVNVNNNININGVLEQPAAAGDAVEMYYQNPLLIKKMFSSLATYGITEVDLLFDHAGLHIRTMCRLGKNAIYYDIDGSCMLAYYCREPICITVSLETMKQTMNLINKNHDKLMFVIKEANRDKLFILAQEPVLETRTSYNINAIGAGQLDLMTKFKDDETKYPVKFVYPLTELKKVVTGVNKSGKNVISFSKEGDSDIQMTLPEGRAFRGTMMLPSTKFKTESHLGPDDMILVTVLGSNIKNFTDAAIGDSVSVYLDTEKSLCLSSCEDLRNGNWGIRYRVFISPVAEAIMLK